MILIHYICFLLKLELPLLRRVLFLREGNCHLTMLVIKGRCAHEELPHTLNNGVLKSDKRFLPQANIYNGPLNFIGDCNALVFVTHEIIHGGTSLAREVLCCEIYFSCWIHSLEVWRVFLFKRCRSLGGCLIGARSIVLWNLFQLLNTLFGDVAGVFVQTLSVFIIYQMFIPTKIYLCIVKKGFQKYAAQWPTTEI